MLISDSTPDATPLDKMSGEITNGGTNASFGRYMPDVRPLFHTLLRYDSFQSLGSFCGQANGPLTVTFNTFLVVIDIH